MHKVRTQKQFITIKSVVLKNFSRPVKADEDRVAESFRYALSDTGPVWLVTTLIVPPGSYGNSGLKINSRFKKLSVVDV